MRLPQVLSIVLSILCLAIAAFPQGESSAAADTKAAILGTVTNQKGKGIPGAEILIEGDAGFKQQVQSDSEGQYAVADLPAGSYTVRVLSRGTKVFEGGTTLAPSQVLTLSISAGTTAGASNANGALTGIITDEKGAGVGNAVVSLDNGAGFTQDATTDSQGQYFAKQLPAGTYNVAVAADGKKIFQGTASLVSGQQVTLNLSGPLVPQAQAVQASAVKQAPAQPAEGQAQAPSESVVPILSATPAMPVLAGSPQAVAQTSPSLGGKSTFSGTVTDQTGAVVIGATVKATNASGGSATAITDDKGNYTLRGLTAGTYHLTVTASGFKQYDLDNVALSEAQSLPLDAGLEPAGSTTEVNVEGQKVAEVETENAQVQGVVTQKEVQTLQLNGRNFTQLIALTPGVSNQTGQDEAKVGVTGSVRYSVNGGRVEYNSFEVDGSDVLNAGLNGNQSTLMVYPSLDAIQEVKVLTSNYGAMYGRTASGTVLVTTKGGTAQWHGSAYEFLRNEAFNARNYFDQTISAPLYRRNDFGFTIGGPLYIPGFYNEKKDKTFVFWSEEFRIEKSPSDLEPDFNQAVPSLAERQGDFSGVCPPSLGPTVENSFNRTQFPDCPSSGPSSSGGFATFPGNNIAASNSPAVLDTNALAILSTNLIPLPNSNKGCNSTTGSCYDAVISEPTHWRQELFRIDHNINQKLQATFRYIHDSWDTVTPTPEWGYLQNGLNLRNSFPTVQNKFVGPGVSLVARLTATITPTLLNEFTASYTNSHITLNNTNGPGGATYLRPAGLGMPGGACTPVNTPKGPPVGNFGCLGALFNNGFGDKAPGVIIGGTNLEYGGGGFAVDPAYMPWQHTNPTYSLRDDISKSIGKHTLQMGVQVIYWQRNQTNNSIGAASGDLQGLLTFNNTNGGRLNTGNSFANFLAFFTNGNETNNIQSFQQDSAQSRYYNRYTIGEPYIQDDWKVNQRLTLNMGIRFSLFGLFHEKYNNVYNWDPNAYSALLASQLSVNPSTGQLVNGPGGTGTPIPLNLQNLDPRITNGIVHCGTNFVPSGCMTGHLFNPAPRIGFAWDPWGDGKTSVRAGYGIFFEHGTGQEANTGSLEGSAPVVLSVTQIFPVNYGCIGGSQGAACVPFPPGGTAPGAFPISVTAIPTSAVWSNAQQWSLSIQRELPKYFVATLAYVGSKGTHLTAVRQLNQLRPLTSDQNPFGPNEPLIPATGNVSNSLEPGDCSLFNSATGFSLLNGTVVGAQNPAYNNLVAACQGTNVPPAVPVPNVNTLRPYPGLNQIFSLQNVANSGYNALQGTVRRTKGPLTVGVSYAYSHSIDDSSDRADSTLANSYDLRSNRASSNFDQRHLLNISYIYNFPKLSSVIQRWSQGPDGESPGQVSSPATPSRWARIIGDGWQFSGITVVQSGTPFSVINRGSASFSVEDNAGVANGVGVGSYPDIMRNAPPVEKLATNNLSFGPLLGNPNEFVAPRGLTFGDAGRNFFNNPRRTNFDMSLLKTFQIKESQTLEFRAEAFNVFNHTQFRIYNPDLGNTGSNTISCYGGPNYSAGFYSNLGTDCLTGSGLLHPVDAHRPRTIQLALKFSF